MDRFKKTERLPFWVLKVGGADMKAALPSRQKPSERFLNASRIAYAMKPCSHAIKAVFCLAFIAHFFIAAFIHPSGVFSFAETHGPFCPHSMHSDATAGQHEHDPAAPQNKTIHCCCLCYSIPGAYFPPPVFDSLVLAAPDGYRLAFQDVQDLVIRSLSRKNAVARGPPFIS